VRGVILAVLCGLALAPTPLRAAPVPTKALPGELGVAPSLELVRDGCGRGWHRHHWRDQWGSWHGATAFRTKGVLTAAGARGRTIRPHIGAVLPGHGVGNP
jgi:hypothetical protein